VPPSLIKVGKSLWNQTIWCHHKSELSQQFLAIGSGNEFYNISAYVLGCCSCVEGSNSSIMHLQPLFVLKIIIFLFM